MRPNVTLVCHRCAQHRSVTVRTEQGKRRGYCEKCIKFLRGEITEAEAPPERASIRAQRSGWMRHNGSQSKNPSSDV
jgi:hypothetical protein